jgi:hypothetical protein
METATKTLKYILRNTTAVFILFSYERIYKHEPVSTCGSRKLPVLLDETKSYHMEYSTRWYTLSIS